MAMGPVEHEANPTSPLTESGLGSEAIKVLTPPVTSVSEESEGERLSFPSSSSSSSSSSSEDLDGRETSTSKLAPGDNTSPAELESEDILVSSMPLNDQEHHTVPSNDKTTLDSENEPEAPTQSPPTQFMERPADQTAPSAYRIPSRVFSRAKSTSTAPMDWSVTSNESLFSIQGNMSFTRDQMAWLGKSGELGLPGEISMVSSPLANPVFSGPLFELQSHQITEPSEIGLKNSHAIVDERFGVTESKAAETLREVIKENEEELNKEKAYARESVHTANNSASLSHLNSNDSGARVKSFAFPILAMDDKSASISSKRHTSSPRQSSQPVSPKVVHLQHRHSHQEPNPKTPQQETTPRVTPANPFILRRWLSCFSCCRFCS